MVNIPKRPRTFFERHSTWIIVGFIGLIVLGATAIIARMGLLENVDPQWFGRNLRGYTAIGLTLGVLAVVFTLLTFLYSIRKRALQERLPRFMRGTMMSWLWSHVYLGLLALIASILHAGYGLIGGNWFSTGKMLFYVFLAIILSGVLWRLIYNVVPKRNQPKIHNYSDAISIGRAETARVEIEKLLAGKSNEFRDAAEQLLAGKKVAHRDPAWSELVRLVAKRDRGLVRKRNQDSVTRTLQGLRWLHIPLGLAFVGLLVAHIVWVFDVPAKGNVNAAGAFHPVENCVDCHADIVAQWTESMHAHAVTSPVTIVQTNQAFEQNLLNEDAPDPQLLCNNCHAPVGVLLTDQEIATLPLGSEGEIADNSLLHTGVDCATCHQFSGEPSFGLAGASVYQDDLVAGRVMFGGNVDSVGNAYHQGQHVTRFDNAETTCMSCHNVMMDRGSLDENGVEVDVLDGRNQDAGIDLVLQTTYREYIQEYRDLGGRETCLDCHMKVLPVDRIASSAHIPTQQDYIAPPRTVRSHAFVGVDYPLDTVAERDPQRAEREKLLQESALFSIASAEQITDTLTFTISVENNNLGHKLPTGFAFARQMWIEVIVADEAGSVLFESGVVDSNVADLCDHETLGNAMAEFVVGCEDGVDKQLVNFQQELVDDVEPLRDENGDIRRDRYGNTIGIAAEGSIETPLQNLNGGAVARKRADDQAIFRLSPNPNDDTHEQTFEYVAPVPANTGTLTISARLRFRNLPPYFLRALAAGQTPESLKSEPAIAPIIKNLIIVDMNTAERIVTP